MLLGQAIVVFVEDVIAEAGSVQHQHARCDIAPGWAQSRVPVRVKAFQHLQVADLRRVVFRGRVEVQQSLLDTLQHCGAAHGLGR